MKFKYNEDNKFYWYSANIDNKSCVIAFIEDKGEKDINKIYSVAFGIGSNRKQVLNWMFNENHFIDNKITGSGNIKYLIFAKNMLIEFEKFIKSKKPSEKIIIKVEGADKRRFNVYRKVLVKYGYNESWSKLLKII
jgi:hypothetical protein